MKPEIHLQELEDHDKIMVRIDGFEDRMSMIQILASSGYITRIIEKGKEYGYDKIYFVQFWIPTE